MMDTDCSKSPVLLQVRDLRTYFYLQEGILKAVDGVDFEIRRGEIFGLVGESGSGKSVTALSILRLIEEPGRIINGDVLFDRQSLYELSEQQLVQLRGNRIAMIFQHPQASLNPVFTVGGQVAEILQLHQRLVKREAWTRAAELFGRMGIADVERQVRAYPHELSGGQAQRVMIAMALALEPDLLIADEPTTALDVTIQAQILNLLKELRSEMKTSIILISHDLSTIAGIADFVAVMYAGQIVEQAEVDHLFDKPQHPYTRALITSIPIPGKAGKRLGVIPGMSPNPMQLPTGCRFAPRCQEREEYGLTICNEREPFLQVNEAKHLVRCWLYQDRKEPTPPTAMVKKEAWH